MVRTVVPRAAGLGNRHAMFAIKAELLPNTNETARAGGLFPARFETEGNVGAESSGGTLPCVGTGIYLSS
jgi:hypothetical protein